MVTCEFEASLSPLILCLGKKRRGAGKREEGKGREGQNQRWAEVLAIRSRDLRWIPVAHVKVEAENQHH